MPDLNDLIGNLKRFNRKERFHLLNKVSGGAAFRIDRDFATCLEREIECPVIPKDAFMAMDYHLDWLHVALHLHKLGKVPERNRVLREANPNNSLFHGNQEDIDMLIAFRADEEVHLILIEAKADTAWSSEQANRKAERLCKIFGNAGTNYGAVYPHFAIMSPSKPIRLSYENWPNWMLCKDEPHFVPLPLCKELLRIARCDSDGSQSAGGTSLSFKRVTHAGSYSPQP